MPTAFTCPVWPPLLTAVDQVPLGSRQQNPISQKPDWPGGQREQSKLSRAGTLPTVDVPSGGVSSGPLAPDAPPLARAKDIELTADCWETLNHCQPCIAHDPTGVLAAAAHAQGFLALFLYSPR